MPKVWPLSRKGGKFIIKSKTSRKMTETLPLLIAMRDMLKYVKNAKEARRVINNKNVLVNKKAARDFKSSIGLMDVIEFPKLKTQFRVLLNKQGRFKLEEIDAKENSIRPAKIIGKRVLKGKKVQLNLDDGSNIILKDKADYKVGDSVLIDLEKHAIKEHLPMKKGAAVYMVKGNKAGSLGIVESIKEFAGVTPANILFKHKGKTVETRKAYAFVVGKTKSAIKIEENE